MDELSRDEFCALAKEAIAKNISLSESGTTHYIDPEDVCRAFSFDFPLVQPREIDALSKSLLECLSSTVIELRLPRGVYITPQFIDGVLYCAASRTGTQSINCGNASLSSSSTDAANGTGTVRPKAMEGSRNVNKKDNDSKHGASSSSAAISLLCAVLFVKLPRAILASAGAGGEGAAAAVLQYLMQSVRVEEAEVDDIKGGGIAALQNGGRLAQLQELLRAHTAGGVRPSAGSG